jgi:hypothetical protein
VAMSTLAQVTLTKRASIGKPGRRSCLTRGLKLVRHADHGMLTRMIGERTLTATVVVRATRFDQSCYI